MQRRNFLKGMLLGVPSLWVFSKTAYAKTYMTVEEAKQVLWGDTPLTPQLVSLTKAQGKSISKKAKTRVRNLNINTWRTPDGDWFIVDQVIGKHENIDLAVAMTADGKVKGLEVLVYRETYGHQVMHPKWRAQFYGRDNSEHLLLDKQIRNISGATLSCRHVTDGVNRLTTTWDQVLRHL